jgi:hypothetical protein
VWQSTGNSSNALVGSNPTSPRLQTLTDSYVYSLIQYHLLEPPTGNGTWTGTNQFTLNDLVQSFMRRRDTVLQIAACNIGPFSNNYSIPPGANRVQLPDTPNLTILDVRRVRFIPDSNISPTIPPSILYRDDTLAMEFFENDYQQNFNIPFAWDVLGSPPQELTFDSLVSVANTLDMLVMLSGGTVTPPTAAPLLIPDDFFWVLKWGIMADVLQKQSESTDRQRAQYCEQRFAEGLRLMVEMPWLTQGFIDRVPVDTMSVAEADQFGYEWQTDPNMLPLVIRGGVDLFALAPTLTQSTAVTLSLIGNAPIPPHDTDPIEIPRDVLDAVIGYAQHLATFKMGGQDFVSTIPLYENMVQMALKTNERLRESGIFATTLRAPNSRQDADTPRFAMEAAK